MLLIEQYLFEAGQKKEEIFRSSLSCNVDALAKTYGENSNFLYLAGAFDGEDYALKLARDCILTGWDSLFLYLFQFYFSEYTDLCFYASLQPRNSVLCVWL